MPRKTAANDSATAPVRAAKPKTPKPVIEGTPKTKIATPRVTSATHKTDAPTRPVVDRHEQIAKIAYGYWEARGFQAGSAEEDWLRAEQEFLLMA